MVSFFLSAALILASLTGCGASGSPAQTPTQPQSTQETVSQAPAQAVPGENNTAYGGQRSSTAMHYQVAEDHGFTAIADFVVLDEDGSVSLPVEGGTHLTENLVGVHFPEYDGYLVLSISRGTQWRRLRRNRPGICSH